MINLGYRSTPDYPYDYRIELIDYSKEQRQKIADWLKDSKIPYTVAGKWPCDVIYMRRREAMWFVLRWTE